MSATVRACPSLDELPAPPRGRSGFPWDVESPRLADTMPDGREWPVISIVTPSYNQAAFLEETLRSVLLQGYPRLQYVVLDGGSTDGSCEILERYAPWLAHHASRRDDGQTDAINQGFALTSGAIFQWINSDDCLEPGSLGLVAERCPPDGAFAASIRMFGDGPEQVFANRDLEFGKLVRQQAIFAQPAFWLSRPLAERCFPLDKTLHCEFDLELVLRASFERKPIVYDPRVTTRFRLHPQSKTVARSAEFGADRSIILRKLAGDPRFASEAPLCLRALRALQWKRAVDELRAGQHPFGSLRLAAAILRAPGERATRYALGALRRELMREAQALVSRVRA